MSFWVIAMDAARMAVKIPIAATRAMTCGALAKIGFARATRETPALTIVAAWISAETGVGPSIASGSQTCSGNWALLPTAPAKISRAMIQIGIIRESGGQTVPIAQGAVVADGPISAPIDSRMFRVCVLTKIAMIPSAKP